MKQGRLEGAYLKKPNDQLTSTTIEPKLPLSSLFSRKLNVIVNIYWWELSCHDGSV